MRYYCPMLIGTFPVTIQLLGGAEGSAHPRQRWITALLGFGLFAVFFPSLQRRFRQIRDHGSPLAFTSLATSEFYGAYNRDVLHGKTQAIHQTIQALVPAGEPIIVWTQAPFWLNFARNPIFNTSQHGLGLPRKTFPRVRFVVWQYNCPALLTRENYQQLTGAAGMSDRVSATRTLEFIDELERLARTSDILFNEGGYALIRVRN